MQLQQEDVALALFANRSAEFLPVYLREITASRWSKSLFVTQPQSERPNVCLETESMFGFDVLMLKILGNTVHSPVDTQQQETGATG